MPGRPPRGPALLASLLALAACGEPRPIVDEVYEQLRTWVVDCRLRYRRGGLHEGGIMNPGAGALFHGAQLRATGWRFDSCGTCHGDDLTGGKVGVSCLTGHRGGPTTCGT